jgi:hypothetical protein
MHEKIYQSRDACDANAAEAENTRSSIGRVRREKRTTHLVIDFEHRAFAEQFSDFVRTPALRGLQQLPMRDIEQILTQHTQHDGTDESMITHHEWHHDREKNTRAMM